MSASPLEDSTMSLKPQEDFRVPDETRRVALAAFPKGCACLRIADALGGVYRDKQFAALFPRRGQPAESPWRLSLATVLQFTERSPTDRRRMRFGAESTGSMHSAWSWRTRASTIPC